MLIISLLLFYIGNRWGDLFFIVAIDYDLVERFSFALNNLIPRIRGQPFYISWQIQPLLIGGLLFGLMWIIYAYREADRKNFLRGIEHGSARWAKSHEINDFVDKEKHKNILLTNTEKLSINQEVTGLNCNTLVVASSGKGKTRFYVKPNLMQMHSNYIVTDPKGTILSDCGQMLIDNGYKIKVFNNVNFERSMHYNPFNYITSEVDILKFVNALIQNTRGKDSKEDFWVNAEKLLYYALVGYIFYEYEPVERNFKSLLDLLGKIAVKDNGDDDEQESEGDLLFRRLERKSGSDHFAVRQYKKFKDAAGESAKSVLFSCGTRMAPFDLTVIREITEYDEMSFHDFPEEKTALFIVIDDKNATFNFLVALLYSQLFDVLCYLADNKYGGKLPIHHRMELDEFANIGKIADFEKLIATIRSREISCSVIIQSFAQLKSIYKDDENTIIENCASLLYLGGTGKETPKYISEMADKTTIDHRSYNETKGRNGSTSVNNAILGRDLITPSEVRQLKRDECLLFVDGLHPFKSKKFDIKKHPNYKLLAESNASNFFDVEQYLKQDNDDWIKGVDTMNNLIEIEVTDEDIAVAFDEYPEYLEELEKLEEMYDDRADG